MRVGRLRPRGVVSAAAAACRGRPGAPTRASSLRRYPSLVVNGRSSSPARELAAATCPYRPYDPARSSPVPPHHPDTPHQRRPAAGGVKRGRIRVRQGFITHQPLFSLFMAPSQCTHMPVVECRPDLRRRRRATCRSCPTPGPRCSSPTACARLPAAQRTHSSPSPPSQCSKQVTRRPSFAIFASVA